MAKGSRENILCAERAETLLAKIEDLRCHLIKKARDKEHLSDHSLVEISQELDKYIVEFQLRHMKRLDKHERRV
jgi:hypothetical protein